MSTTDTLPPIPSKTGRTYTRHMHQLEVGDVIRWNSAWLRVESIARDPYNPSSWLQVRAHCSVHSGRAHGSTASGEECAPVEVVPRSFVTAAP